MSPPTPDCRARGKQQDKMLRESWALSLPQDPTWEAKKHKDLLASNDYMDSLYNFPLCGVFQ